MQLYVGMQSSDMSDEVDNQYTMDAGLHTGCWLAKAEFWFGTGDITHRCLVQLAAAAGGVLERVYPCRDDSYNVVTVNETFLWLTSGGDGVEQLEVELESGAHQHTDSGDVSLVVRTEKPL